MEKREHDVLFEHGWPSLLVAKKITNEDLGVFTYTNERDLKLDKCAARTLRIRWSFFSDELDQRFIEDLVITCSI